MPTYGISSYSSQKQPVCKRFANVITSQNVRASLYNHLSDTGAAKGLAADEGLPAEAGEEIADGRQRQENGRCNQAANGDEYAEILDHGHDDIGGGAEVVGRNLADKLVELARGWADAQEKRHLDEQDEEGRGTIHPILAPKRTFMRFKSRAKLTWRGRRR